MRSWGRSAINNTEIAYWLDQIIPASLEFRDVSSADGGTCWRIGTAELGDGQALAVTVGFSHVDTRLARADDDDVNVRCELLAVGRTSPATVAAAVQAAADNLWAAGGIIPAQPGVLLPNMAAGSALERDESVTVRHGLLIAPYLWGGQTPQVAEDKRLTLICQLLVLTDAEYSYAADEGVGPFQQAVADSGIDLLDFSRADG